MKKISALMYVFLKYVYYFAIKIILDLFHYTFRYVIYGTENDRNFRENL